MRVPQKGEKVWIRHMSAQDKGGKADLKLVRKERREIKPIIGLYLGDRTQVKVQGGEPWNVVPNDDAETMGAAPWMTA